MEWTSIRTWRIPDQAGALPNSLSPETAQGTHGDILIVAPTGALLIVNIAHFAKIKLSVQGSEPGGEAGVAGPCGWPPYSESLIAPPE